METKAWGGVDHESELRCHHGNCPRRLVCWDGKNTGRRYLGCAERVPFHYSFSLSLSFSILIACITCDIVGSDC